LLLLILAASPSIANDCPDPAPVINDVCDSAIPLGENPQYVMLTGHTGMATHDYDIGHDNPCTGDRSDGPDVVYSVVLHPECVLNATLHNCDPVGAWYDQSLYMVNDCINLLAKCAGSDTPCFEGNCAPEAASWDNDTGVNQTVYIILDGKFPSSAGSWILEVSTDCVVPVDESTWGMIKATYSTP
jgi:hypothetical protein